jgi:hypothetical protein
MGKYIHCFIHREGHLVERKRGSEMSGTCKLVGFVLMLYVAADTQSHVNVCGDMGITSSRSRAASASLSAAASSSCSCTAGAAPELAACRLSARHVARAASRQCPAIAAWCRLSAAISRAVLSADSACMSNRVPTLSSHEQTTSVQHQALLAGKLITRERICWI